MADIDDESRSERCWVQKCSFSSPTQSAGMDSAFLHPWENSKYIKLTSACNQDTINLTIKLMPPHKTGFWDQKRQMDTLKKLLVYRGSNTTTQWP